MQCNSSWNVRESFGLELTSDIKSILRQTDKKQARAWNMISTNLNYSVSLYSLEQSIHNSSVCLLVYNFDSTEIFIIRITKQIKQPCNNEWSMLPYLPSLCSPRQKGAAERYLHVPFSQPSWGASIQTIRWKKVTTIRTEGQLLQMETQHTQIKFEWDELLSTEDPIPVHIIIHNQTNKQEDFLIEKVKNLTLSSADG